MSAPPAERVVMNGETASDDRAWVVFRAAEGRWWRRLTRPGFGHCLVILPAARHWLVMDPLWHLTDLGLVPRDVHPDLPGELRQRGMVVVATVRRRADTRPAPLALFTCVEAVKRVLGLRAPWALTPWRLYRALTRQTPHQARPNSTMLGATP